MNRLGGSSRLSMQESCLNFSRIACWPQSRRSPAERTASRRIDGRAGRCSALFRRKATEQGTNEVSAAIPGDEVAGNEKFTSAMLFGVWCNGWLGLLSAEPKAVTA